MRYTRTEQCREQFISVTLGLELVKYLLVVRAYEIDLQVFEPAMRTFQYIFW